MNGLNELGMPNTSRPFFILHVFSKPTFAQKPTEALFFKFVRKS